jgi:hypothetical protein
MAVTERYSITTSALIKYNWYNYQYIFRAVVVIELKAPDNELALKN